MAIRLSGASTHYLTLTSAALDTAIQAAITAGKDIAIMCNWRMDARTGTSSSRVISIGDSDDGTDADTRGILWLTGNGRGIGELNGVASGNVPFVGGAAGEMDAGDTAGVALIMPANGENNTLVWYGGEDTEATDYNWGDEYDMLRIGYQAFNTTPSGNTINGAIEHVAIVALDSGGFTTAIKNQIRGNGVKRLSALEIFDTEDIIAYFPLKENLDSYIFDGEVSSSLTLTAPNGFVAFDDFDKDLYQPDYETISASDYSGAFLGNTKPTSIRCSRSSNVRVVELGDSAGTTVADGWKATSDVLIRSIQPDSDGLVAAEGVGGEHVRPICVGKDGTQIGTGSSVARLYYRKSGESSWTRSDDTNTYSGAWSFPDGDEETFILFDTSEMWYQATTDTIENWVSVTNDHISAINGPDLTTGETVTFDGGSRDIAEAIRGSSVGTGPNGIACFAPYSGPSADDPSATAGDFVRKVYATDDYGRTWTEVMDLDDEAFDDDWDSEIAGDDNRKRPKHFHGVHWVESEQKFYCFYGDGYSQSGAITIGPDPSSPNATVDALFQLPAEQLFDIKLFKDKLIGGCDRIGGNGYHDISTGQFTGLEKFLYPQAGIRHNFYCDVFNGIGLFGPHAESDDDGFISSVPIMVIKDLSGLYQIAGMLSRNENGAATLPRIDNTAGIRGGVIDAQITDDGAFKHYEVTLPKLRTVKGFAVTPQRANIFNGTMATAGNFTWSGTGSYNAAITNSDDPDGTSNLAAKSVVTSGNQSATSYLQVADSQTNKFVPASNVPGYGLDAFVKCDIRSGSTMEWAMGGTAVETIKAAMEQGDRWQHQQFPGVLSGSSTAFLAKFGLVADIGISSNDGHGEFWGSTGLGEMEAANLTIARVPSFPIFVTATNGDAGESNYVGQVAQFYEWEETTGDGGFTYLFHVTPHHSWWSYKGNKHNEKYVIAEIEKSDGSMLRLSCLPVAYSTVDTVSGGSNETVALDDSIVTSDMEGNCVFTAPDEGTAPDANYIETVNSATSIDLTAGTYSAPAANDHVHIEALQLYFEAIGSDGVVDHTATLGRFNVLRGVAIPIAISSEPAGLKVRHAAEGKLQVDTNASHDANDYLGELTVRHGSRIKASEIFSHEVTVCQWYDDALSDAEVIAAFSNFASDSSSGATTLGGNALISGKAVLGGSALVS